MRLSILPILWLLGSASLAQDIELERTNSRWRVGLESFDADALGDAELLGVHYDVLGLWSAYRPFYLGLGGYTQLSGETDGFFAAGVTSGVLYKLNPRWRFEGGLFLGGGALSGNAGQNGLVTRPFVAFERLFQSFGLRAEVSYLELEHVEGDVTLSLGVTLPSEWLEASRDRLPDRIPKAALVERETRLTPRYLSLDPTSSAKRRNGLDQSDDFELIGLGFDYFLDERWFIPIEAYGASGGNQAGLGIGLVGLGYRLPLGASRFSLEAKGSLGVAAGDQSDTGGGLAVAAGAALRAELTESLSAELGTTLLDAPNGEFGAAGLSLGLSWTLNPLELAHEYPRGQLWESGLADEDAELNTTRFGVINKFYSPTGTSQTEGGRPLDDTITLVGIEVEQSLGEYLAATGRGFVAWDGDVGGYREGLLGLRASYSTYEHPEHVYSIGYEAGAAGGGQVDVGGGLLLNFYAGYRYLWDETKSVSFEYGRTKSSTGLFEAESVSFGLSWNLQRAVAR